MLPDAHLEDAVLAGEGVKLLVEAVQHIHHLHEGVGRRAGGGQKGVRRGSAGGQEGVTRGLGIERA
eukprot:5126-Prorocentrum_minimum.AAC.1